MNLSEARSTCCFPQPSSNCVGPLFFQSSPPAARSTTLTKGPSFLQKWAHVLRGKHVTPDISRFSFQNTDSVSTNPPLILTSSSPHPPLILTSSSPHPHLVLTPSSPHPHLFWNPLRDNTFPRIRWMRVMDHRCLSADAQQP